MWYGVKLYLGKDLGWLFQCDSWGNVLRFPTEDKADEYARQLEFSYNKLIYEVKEIKDEIE